MDLGVTNPVAGLSRIAVVPFFNLSPEPSADGHRFADAYFAELQKVPGFQVLPVGVAEAAIQDLQLDLQNPEDAMKLGQILGVDAVVVGAITDYNPYYPPRVGLQVSWYSAHPWGFSPGVPTEPLAPKRFLNPSIARRNANRRKGDGTASNAGANAKRDNVYAEHSTLFRGQSEAVFPPRPMLDQPTNEPPNPDPPLPLIPPELSHEMLKPLPPVLKEPPLSHPLHEPLMSYTRLFDGSDSELTATLTGLSGT